MGPSVLWWDTDWRGRTRPFNRDFPACERNPDQAGVRRRAYISAMDPVDKALWFIESHFAQELSLDDIAAIAGVSRFQLVRAFGYATGTSVMRYVRARRLTEAARALAGGAPDILAVALDAGYGSHEAFTRAFRDQFGVTPEAVRADRSLANLQPMEPIRMTETPTATLAPPRFETTPALLIAGLGERFSHESIAGIPALWQRFNTEIDHVPGKIGQVAYGVCFNTDDAGTFDYIAGVQVRDYAELPKDYARVRIQPQRYAVFTHREHISTIRSTVTTIWSKWLPTSGFQAADAPFFERYGPEFDGRTGLGGFEIWLAIK
jgi:AraC family transcriptional regulator